MKKSLNILHISKKSSNFAAGFINRNIRYSYDMCDMLTETRNKHFSERLFYADSLSLLPQYVVPCRNGNQIVNLYDAAGRKYKSITYTNIASVIPQQYDFAHYSFETDSLNYHVTEYAGNIELHKIKDTALTTFRRIHNTIGYYDTSDSTYFHYIKDHLGNICAVVNSTADTVVQRTMYYASGVPMAQSWGRETQPYLYNSKEFVEAHGYNTYDYGFRGYYATIGRFTTIDPIAEQTPWQSPYAYANNNFINAIDWMGLDAITISGQAAQDFFSYLVGGGDWKTYDYSGWDDVTDEWEHGFFDEYGRDWYYYSVTAGPGGGGNWGGNIAKVTVERVVNASKYIDFCKSVGEYALKLGEQGTEAVSFGINAWMADQWNPFGWEGAKGQYYDRSFLYKRGGYANSFKRAGERVLNSRWGKLGTKLGYVSIGLSGMDMLVNGPSVKSGIDIGIAGLGIIATSIAAPELILFCTIYGFTDIGVTWATGNSISGWIDYGVHQGINYFTEE